MKSEIRRRLHDLLIQDSISLESNIVNDLVCQMIGLETKKTDIGFDLSVHQWKKEDETIYFSVSKISYADLMKCLDFFKIPHENYITDKSLILDNKDVLNELLAKFEVLYKSLKVENPSAFAQYQVKSRPILEASAIATIADYSKKALNAIDATAELSDLQKNILDTVILLGAKIGLLSTYPSLYKSVNEMDQRIKAFISHPELSNNKELLGILKLISEGNALFKQYHRYESVIANKKFKKEMEAFLNTSVAISATQCDVTENTLLQLAGAILGPKGKASYDTGSDRSRLVFNFTDITKENAEKLVTFCVKMGDETASLGYGSRKHGSVLAQSASLEKCMRMESSFESFNDEPQIVLESHSIEVDGEFFYNTIFPELKNAILEMDANNSEVITSYREASKTYLEKKAAINSPKISDNKSTLFQSAQPTNDVVSTTSSLSI